MATAGSKPGIGQLVREWRERRHLSQLEVALDAGISARHLSFVETGRSKPGRDMLLRVLERLDVPYREQNRLLLAAGHAPAFPERSLEDPDLAPVRDALDRILTAHEPNPAIAFDRSWNLVAANSVTNALVELVDFEPGLLKPPVNVIRAGLHPRGLAPLIANLADWRAYFLRRLERQVALTGDDELAALLDEVAGYPGGESARDRDPEQFLGPLKVHAPGGGELSFFGMFATFDTPFEVTTSELAFELAFPADTATAETMRVLAGHRIGGTSSPERR
jgi:transcriptional regulator with XRE-family HTH domain